MAQYLLRKEKDFDNLKFALENYELMSLFIRPCLTGDHTKEAINLILKNEEFEFVKKKDLTFLVNEKPIINFPLREYRDGFMIEYLNEKMIPAWTEIYHPMDPGLPKVHSTLLRNGLDGLLVEIQFKGKIGLEFDGYFGTHIDDGYWKLKK